MEGRQAANHLEKEQNKKRKWRRGGIKKLSTDFRDVFWSKNGTKKESSHDLIFINNEPHSKFILIYMENKLFYMYVCQFTIFRNLKVYVFKLSESEVS